MAHSYRTSRWLLPLLRPRPAHSFRGTRHLLFCVADHFEPFGFQSPEYHPLDRVRRWVSDYQSAFADLRDADGCPPRQTLFCSAEEYDPEYLALLAPFCGQSLGEVEIHLHHRHDTAEGLRDKLSRFRDVLHNDHGLLGTDAAGTVRYGFVHGNWALCNSRPDGDWCGVNEELSVLRRTGCYADFTFPSAPSPTQPRMVNAIYRAWDDPNGRGQDRGTLVTIPGIRNGRKKAQKAQKRRACGDSSAGDGAEVPASVCSGEKIGEKCEEEQADHASKCDNFPKSTNLKSSNQPASGPPGLMLIQGPLALDWRRRKWGVMPRLENADISRARPPSPQRADLWVRQHIRVRGRPEWVFVKVHTHGAVPYNMQALLGVPMQQTHAYLQEKYNDGKQWRLHYVTAREMYNIARAAEDGVDGDPGEYRDYEVGVPPIRQ